MTPEVNAGIHVTATAEAAYPPHAITRHLQRGSALLLSATIMVGGITVATPEHTSTQDGAHTVAERFPDKPLPHSTDKAVPPTAESLRVVTNLLAQPENPAFAAREKELYDYANTHDDSLENRRKGLSTAFAIREKVAAENDVTVFDPTDTLMTLGQHAYPEQSDMTLSEYITTANAFLSNYDIQITDDDSALYADESRQSPKTRIADTTMTRAIIKSLVEGTANEPKEYTDMLGIKKYLLTSKEGKSGAYIHSGFTGPEGAAIVFYLKHMGSAIDTLHHEQYHRQDYLLSGGRNAMRNDPHFEALTENAPYGKMGPEPAQNITDHRPLLATSMGWLTVDDFYSTRAELTGRVAEISDEPFCTDEANKAEAQLVAAGERTVLTTPYSAEKNVVERKADLGRYIAQGDQYHVLLNSSTPRLADQLRSRLAQLYDYRARVARYFIGMARRDNTPTPLTELCEK